LHRASDPDVGAYETTGDDVSSIMQQAGITRTDLQRHDLSVPGREVIQNRVDISPEAPAGKHKHPGEATTSVPPVVLRNGVAIGGSTEGRTRGHLGV
jgi:quercetin dioxygenase-like cupin family protein